MPLLDYNYNYNYNYSVGGGGGGSPAHTSALQHRRLRSAHRYDQNGGAGTKRAREQRRGHLSRSIQQTGMPICAPACTWTGSIPPPPGGARNYCTVATTAPFQTPQSMTQAALQDQAVQILQLALERDNRFSEIIDQDDGEGAINYTLGMLKIDPARNPATNLMVRIGRRIGEQVAMCLKGDFMSPRPSQLCPAITPMIEPPATPSFPAGHAVQSYLIAYLLGYCLQKLPQHSLPRDPQLCKPGNRVAVRPGGPDLAEPDHRRGALSDRHRGWHSGGDRVLQRSAEG